MVQALASFANTIEGDGELCELGDSPSQDKTKALLSHLS